MAKKINTNAKVLFIGRHVNEITQSNSSFSVEFSPPEGWEDEVRGLYHHGGRMYNNMFYLKNWYRGLFLWGNVLEEKVFSIVEFHWYRSISSNNESRR
jgi:hypothetical protein